MTRRIRVSEYPDLQDLMCEGCQKENLYEEDGVGCLIQLTAQFDGVFPKQWAKGKCECYVRDDETEEEKSKCEKRMAGDWS